MKFYFLKFKNYFDREILKYDSIALYQSYLVADVQTAIVNWTPADGVDTVCILNSYSSVSWLGEPNYVVVTKDNGAIESRWYVMEADQLRNGQYRCKLHRDVIADYYDTVINSPCFIEKAIVPDSNNLIFNSENMTYNQIKTKEILLKDASETAWLVGYTAKNLASKSGTINTSSNYDISQSSIAHTSWTYYSYNSVANALRDTPSLIQMAMMLRFTLTSSTTYNVKYYWYNTAGKSKSEWQQAFNGFVVAKADLNDIYDSDYPSWYDMDNIRLHMAAKFNYSSASQVSTLLEQYQGKRILFSDGIYRINVKSVNYSETANVTQDDGAVFENDLLDQTKNGIRAVTGYPPGNGLSPYFEATVSGMAYYVEFEKINEAGTQITWTLPATRNKLKDAPYDMFAIPLNSIGFGAIPGGTRYTQLGDTGNIVASNMAVQLSVGSSGELYDIQILPYCPFPSAIQSSNTLSTLTLVQNQDYAFIENQENDPVGIILFPSESSFTGAIALDPEDRVTITEPKVQSECDLYRLCSPNYSGVFEFNAAKNGGLTYFEFNCTYKPFNPYIHLNPNFGRLYGKDFNDERGLICGGEFSKAIVNDAWVTYELNNKNYEKSFQRNITSLELQNKFGLIKDVASAVSGTVGAGISGGVNGGAAGAIGATVLSGAAGAADVYMNQRLRRENINLQKDQFSYALGNIQALPYSLSRTTSYSINNKYFPFLEYYTCSDVEKEALRNKIKYEGMTVMAIGKIADYIQSTMSFIKGRMIKIQGDDYYADTHISEAINARISEGIYIGG